MKDFDIVIIGGGCSGLSLAYQLEVNSKLKSRSLAIIDNSCLLYTSPSPRDATLSRMPSSA